MSVVLHWDVENQQVPAGSSVASVCNRIRAVLLERFDCISGLYAYMDVTREKDKIRTQLAMMGYDIIDCSSASGKTGQVDLRIIARALSPAVPNAPKQVVSHLRRRRLCVRDEHAAQHAHPDGAGPTLLR